MYICLVANHYFRFKKFTIFQDRCALKVCTDSCLFGAWASRYLNTAGTILDIGSGTGLLSLMLAQKTHAQITGIELDENTYLQSLENIKQSAWSNRINILQGDCRKAKISQKYEAIISNPPFYVNLMASEKNEEKNAKHEASLTLTELLDVVTQQLIPGGTFAILFPHYRKNELLTAAQQYDLFPKYGLNIRPTPKRVYFRYAVVFSYKDAGFYTETSITVKDELNSYTSDFIELLKDYYLAF